MSGHPATLPLRLYRGDSEAWRFGLWTDEAHTDPLDLTGASAAASIAGPDGGVLELDCTITLPNLIDMVLPAERWNGTISLARWDLQLTWSDGRVYTLLAGDVTVQQDVT